MIYVLIALLSLFVLFLAVILIRAALFRPKKLVVAEPTPCDFDREAAASALRELVRCRTVSRYRAEEEDDGEFERLVALLPTLYPSVAAHCTLTRFPGRALLYRWEGRERGPATVLMSHYDVVPADEGTWHHPPFDGVMENGVLWGRGTLDTKATMNAALFAANTLMERGFVPEHDVYFAFSGSEEVNGEGAPNIVEHFRTEGIEVALVLDEGGAVVHNVFPGVTTPAAMIGTAEKGMIDLEYRVRSSGGHASAPKPHTPIGELALACAAIEAKPMKMHIPKPTGEMFDTLARHSTFLYRVIFANLWCFSPVLNLLAKRSGGEINAMVRTTVAFTRMQGSNANNVLPATATMVSNIRLNPADTVDGTIAYLRKTVDNDRVELRPLGSNEPSRISRVDCEGWERIAAAVRSTWPGTIVTPYLMVQCSDSRHWGVISDRVYRFSAMDLTAEDRRTIHGVNERIRLEVIGRSVEFYLRLIGTC
ncbi:MAG: M20/M25/M40 family metallo-hydrolase [Clostridia bacterium]|nr:M20/M25/M40 family metallo-hydrolase [Clostridia bacterium]